MENRRNFRTSMVGFCFLLFLLGVGILWPDGEAVLKKLLFSGDVAVTAAAWDDFAQQLSGGTQLKIAFMDFCRSIMEGSGFAAG